jgi:hypothetical protein
MRARRTRARVLRPCARACVRVRFGRPGIRADTCERIRSAWTAGGFGSQAFSFAAAAFNANIGVWNTARVTSLSEVCAAFPARAARQCKRDALGGCSVRRGPLCAAATADVCLCANVWARACAVVHVCRHSCA